MHAAVVALASAFLFVSMGCSSTESLSERGYGAMAIAFTTAPSSIVCNQLFDLVIDIDGPGIDAMEIEALHPATRVELLDQPTVTRQADGHWLASGLLLHLPGTWEIEIHVHYNGRVRHHTIRMEV